MSQVDVRERVVYGSGGGRDLRCDIYSPSDRSPKAPALLLLHGGGWSRGDRGMMRDFGQRIAATGFVCIAPEYRLTGESTWPAQIEDVKAAIRWTRAHASELRVDETAIAAMGFSAGAHLALLAAGTPGLLDFAGKGGNEGAREDLAAAVAVYAPVLLYLGDKRPSGASPARTLMGDAATEDLARSASPLAHVDSAFPPAFFIHGTADDVVPVSASRVMYEALVRERVPAEMHLYAGQPHAFARQPEFVDQVSAETVHFLRRFLQAATRAAAEQAPATA